MRFVRTMLPRIAPTPFLSARATLDITAWFYEARRHNVSTAGFERSKRAPNVAPSRLTAVNSRIPAAISEASGQGQSAVTHSPATVKFVSPKGSESGC
jgi:hypothetical protein